MERRGYHHGNLREALIRAASSLIAEKGPAGFTFAEAARSAGVSPAAPYRHFRDRDELMADVARQGFDAVRGHAGAGLERRPARRADRLRQVGKAYLAFARTEPAYYSAMFESGLPLDAHPDLQQAGDRAFAHPARPRADAVCRRLPPSKRPPALMVALHIWSLAHGIASLFGRGDAGAAQAADDGRGPAGGGAPRLPARGWG